MNTLLSDLKKKATGKVVLITFIFTMAVYFFMLLYTIPKVEQFAPGLSLFDLSPTGYSYAHAYKLLETLGETGRNVYLYQQIPADFIYPGLFAISYSLLLIWLFTRSLKEDSKIFYLALVPVFGGLFDYLENIGIIFMITAFPDLPPQLVQISNIFTILKSGFTTGFFLLLFIGIVTFSISFVGKQFGHRSTLSS